MMAVINVNVGILGHVDSGKTSLAKALSEIASTAAFDKNPQSQRRGITLDLGFSCFAIPIPMHLKTDVKNHNTIQYTLVDCPGHASLIRTIIGGAHIVDMMLLVVDATKGIQTQTAECLVIGEITCEKIMIVANKIDLIEEDKRKSALDKLTKRLRVVLSKTAFAEAPIIHVSANPKNLIGIQEAIEAISCFTVLPKREIDGSFLFSVDHCFQIKGQGTIMTGTVLKGCINIGDEIHIPSLNLTKKVKSLQMFRKPIQNAFQGDRLGICVTNVDSKFMERGLICSPGLANYAYCAIMSMNTIKYYKGMINTGAKYHLTIGHETVIGSITLFCSPDINSYDENHEYNLVKCLTCANDDPTENYFVLLQFEKPVIVCKDSIVIGSKLDMDVHTNSCRLAFWGRLISYSVQKDFKAKFLPILKISKTKRKEGVVERVIDKHNVVVKNMFKKKTNLQEFLNFRVLFSTGEIGRIESTFGKSGKVKIFVENGIQDATISSYSKTERGHSEVVDKDAKTVVKVVLTFKTHIFDDNKKMYQ